MSIRSVIQAASALRETNDMIEALQNEKTSLQSRLEEINAELVTLREERDARVATLKQEADTI